MNLELICLGLFFFINKSYEHQPYGWPFKTMPSIPENLEPVETPLFSPREGIPDSVIYDYSPLIYLHSEETFFPSDVDYFLENVYIDDQYMTTKEELECESCTNPKFFKGFNPAQSTNRTPVYALVVNKDQNITDVFYFYFYPYNYGKKVCVGIKINGICVGSYFIFGNHVGDWEHVTVRFQNGKPEKIYYSSHNFGAAVEWSNATGHSEFKTHPIAYCAQGSHGCYPTKGDYVYKKLPNGESLIDRMNNGVLWQTWKNIVILRVNNSKKCCFDKTGRYLSDVIIKKRSPYFEYDNFNWIEYWGSWGNKQGTTCTFGQCVLEGGPSGPFKKGWLFNMEIN